jgi:prephenate dehydrogenase
MPPYDDDEMDEGYGYDDVDETNPDDVEDDTLFEQEEPETDRYMFFSNLEQIHRQMGILLEKDPEMIHSILENGHDWAQDHIATAKESIDQVFDFIMNEENGDDEEDFEDNNI